MKYYVLVMRAGNKFGYAPGVVAHTRHVYRSIGDAKRSRVIMFGGRGTRAERQLRAEDAARIAEITVSD